MTTRSLTLVLVRHAKSDWGDPGVEDHDRPLNDRGRRDAPEMARRLRERGVTPDVILASTALRARSTADAFAAALHAPIRLDPGLYGAAPRTLLAAATAAASDTVMVVAHDPGMSTLAGALSDGGIAHMPTCAVATFTWREDDWDVATAVPPETWHLDTPR